MQMAMSSNTSSTRSVLDSFADRRDDEAAGYATFDVSVVWCPSATNLDTHHIHGRMAPTEALLAACRSQLALGN